jgi:hypothetical protein
MRYIIALMLMVLSVTAQAKPYLALKWSEHITVVLIEAPCQVNRLTGSHAEVRWTNGSKINGCWTFVNEHQHVRIEWDNPLAPGDFAVLRFGDFKLVDPKGK